MGRQIVIIETITKVAEISDRDYQRILNSGEPDGALQDYAHTFGRITDVEVTDLVLDEDPVTPLSFPIDSTRCSRRPTCWCSRRRRRRRREGSSEPSGWRRCPRMPFS